MVPMNNRSSDNRESDEEKEILIGRERRKENILVPHSVLGIVFAIVVQSMGAIWWASGFSSSVSVKLDYLQKTQTDLTQTVIDGTKNRYTTFDAERDWSYNEKRLSSIESDIKILKDKLSDIRSISRLNNGG